MVKYKLDIEEFNLILGALLGESGNSTIPADNKKLREILKEAKEHKAIRMDVDFSNWNPANPMFVIEIGDD